MTQQINLKELGTVVLSSCSVKAVVHVPGLTNGVVTHEGDTARADMVWIATDDHRILFYSAATCMIFRDCTSRAMINVRVI